MKSSVRISDERVAMQLGDMHVSFPDEPFWWSIALRTAETIAALGSGEVDAPRG